MSSVLNAANAAVLKSLADMHLNAPYPIQLGGGDRITVVTTVTGTFTAEIACPHGTVVQWTGKSIDLAHISVARQLDRALEREPDLNLHGFELLRTLASATATRLRVSDLAARLKLTPSGVTRLVARLEGDGSVTRLRDDADRRVVHAHLTARGTARLVTIAETCSATIRGLLSECFSDGELHDLSRALRLPSTTTVALIRAFNIRPVSYRVQTTAQTPTQMHDANRLTLMCGCADVRMCDSTCQFAD